MYTYYSLIMMFLRDWLTLKNSLKKRLDRIIYSAELRTCLFRIIKTNFWLYFYFTLFFIIFNNFIFFMHSSFIDGINTRKRPTNSLSTGLSWVDEWMKGQLHTTFDELRQDRLQHWNLLCCWLTFQVQVVIFLSRLPHVL